MVEKKETVNTTTGMVVAISEKRCGCYAHMCQDEYKMRPNGLMYNKHESRTLNVQNITLED